MRNMKRYYPVRSICLVMLLAVTLLSGCIEWTERTRISADGKCSESIVIAANSFFAEGLRAETKKKEFADMGYRFEIKTDDDKVQLIMSRDFNNAADMYKASRVEPLSGMGEKGGTSAVKGEVKVADFFFVKTFALKETRPSAKISGEGAQDTGGKKELHKIFEKDVFTFKKMIEMPGSIISSNAAEIDKKTATAIWNVSFEDMEKGCTFEVTSRLINIPAVAGTGVLLIIIIIAIVVALVKRAKPQEQKAPQASGS
jgi:hypothetical protein